MFKLFLIIRKYNLVILSNQTGHKLFKRSKMGVHKNNIVTQKFKIQSMEVLVKICG